MKEGKDYIERKTWILWGKERYSWEARKRFMGENMDFMREDKGYMKDGKGTIWQTRGWVFEGIARFWWGTKG